MLRWNPTTPTTYLEYEKLLTPHLTPAPDASNNPFQQPQNALKKLWITCVQLRPTC